VVRKENIRHFSRPQWDQKRSGGVLGDQPGGPTHLKEKAGGVLSLPNLVGSAAGTRRRATEVGAGAVPHRTRTGAIRGREKGCVRQDGDGEDPALGPTSLTL